MNPRIDSRGTRRLNGCENPIQLVGALRHVDGNGAITRIEHASAYASCKTRRATRCETCSQLYQHDARHLIRAGLRGGKGVEETVSRAPGLFITLTAPSFGAIHSVNGESRCHPRRDAGRCPHGRPLACWRVHDEHDSEVGQPVCPDCYDYEGAVLWNNAAPALWRVTRINMSRQIASRLGLPERKAKELARSQYVKVAEFQRRGLVHFHIAFRVDADESVVERFDHDALVDIVTKAAKSASVERADGERATWGAQLDIRPITPEDNDEDQQTRVSRRQVANYLAKYATKGSDIEGKLDRRFRCEDELRFLNINDHLARMVRTSWRLSRQFPDARLDAWSHQLGFRGHFLTKSRGWSTTFKALRQVRIDHNEELRKASWEALSPGSLIVARWSYVGVGYRTTTDAHIAEAIREQRRSERAA